MGCPVSTHAGPGQTVRSPPLLENYQMNLQQEQDQLISHWQKIDLDRLQTAAARVRAAVARAAPTKTTNHLIRQFHNILGYRAAGSVERGGVCAGCMYRTADFVNVSQDLRTGSRTYHENQTRIHVEHTVPVSTLVDHLESVPAAFTLLEFVTFLIQCSVVTAATEPQGRVLSDRAPVGRVRPGYASRSDVFDLSHKHANLPFMRYHHEQDFVIYNVLNNSTVAAHAFSLADHADCVRLLVAQVPHLQARIMI